MAAVDDELEFDMWDGQFEFFGNNFGTRIDGDERRVSGNGRVYDGNADLILSPITIENFPSNKLRAKTNFSQTSLLEDVTNDVRQRTRGVNLVYENIKTAETEKCQNNIFSRSLSSRVLRFKCCNSK